MHAADGFQRLEHDLLEVDDGRRLLTFMLVLRGGVGGCSCISSSVVKTSRMREILALKESEVLYSS